MPYSVSTSQTLHPVFYLATPQAVAREGVEGSSTVGTEGIGTSRSMASEGPKWLPGASGGLLTHLF